MLFLDGAPVEHHFAVLLDDDCCHLANYKEFENVENHRQYEQELDLLACFFRFETQAVLVGREDHSGKHLQNGTFEVAEAFELVAPCIRDNIREHHCERPPKGAEQEDQVGHICDYIQGALNVCQELEEWNKEAYEQNQIHSLQVKQHLVVVHKR